MDEVRIWNVARSQVQIQANMNQPLTGTQPGLVAYYRFDEGAGIAAYDATTNHLNGTLINRVVRAPSFWAPVITLNGPNPLINELHVPFVDPGAQASASPVAIEAGMGHSLALKADGSVVVWGWHPIGQTNIPPSATNVMAIAAGDNHSLGLKADGTVVGWGYNGNDRANGGLAGSNVVAVAAGLYHSLALKADGTVVGWGRNEYGQTNTPANATNVVAIAAQGLHSLALKADGTVVGWGYNYYGQTNIPPSATNGVVAIAAGLYHSLALKADGSVAGWGWNHYGQTTIPPSATNGVVAIAAGGAHSLALKADGSVVGWGDNYYGQTTIPDSATNGVVAIAAGDYHSLALKADGSVLGWGYNDYGQATGVPNHVSPYASTGVVAVAGQTLTNVVAIVAGRFHSLALKADGKVVGWGAGTTNTGTDSNYGQVMIPANATNVVALSAGYGHSLALKGDGTVVGWGHNQYGQATGVSNNVYPYASTGVVMVAGQALTNMVAIAAGAAHGLALKTDGTVVNWGVNNYGQTDTPASATNVVAVAAGYLHNLALKANGTVIGWGYNDDGQTNTPASVYQLNLALSVSGTVEVDVFGTYVLTYRTTNALGAGGTGSRTVLVASRPLVTTEPASGLSAAQPTLHGTVNPRGAETWSWFEYGLTTRYGSATTTTSLGSGPNPLPFASTVAGLLPWMTYHYRAVASNAIGRTEGLDGTFTPGPSTVSPSLSPLADLTMPQGGIFEVGFTMSAAELDVRAGCNNPVLLPNGTLTFGGSGTTRWLRLAPDARHSGSAQVTVTASDGTRAASSTFNLTVTPSSADYHSSLLYLTNAQVVSTQAWRFRIVDAGTGSTNYVVEYRSDLSPTNSWTSATNVTFPGGGVIEVATGAPQQDTGFYRVKGLRLLSAGFSSSELTAEEGTGAAGAVVVFNGPFTGILNYTWTDAGGTNHTGTVEVNGTTAVIPVPAWLLSDNPSIGRLQYLALRLATGPNYAVGGTTESRVTIEENDAEWVGVLQTANGTLGFELTLLQTSGSLQGQIKSGGSGFFPTNALAQLSFAENTFTAVAANVALPPLANNPLLNATHYVDLRLDAANAPGQTNVSPTQVQGVATLVTRLPNRPYLDTVLSGTFVLLRPPTAPSTNEVPLTPVFVP